MDPTQPSQPPSDPPPPEQQHQPPPPHLQPPSQPQSSSSLPSSSSSLHPSSSPPIPSPNPNPNPNPNPKTLTPLLQPESQPQQPHQQIQQLDQDQRKEHHDQLSGFHGTQSRPPLGRQWHQPPHVSHFPSHHISSLPGPSAASSPSPRGGTAIGVPAAIRPGLAAQPNAFASSFGYGGVPRNPANVSEQPTNSASSTGRPAMHGVQTTGMINPQMQHNVFSGSHLQRPVQLPYRPQSGSINQPSTSHSFQGHGIMRASSIGSSNSAMSTPQGPTQNQVWMSSTTHGRPPMAIPPRSQINPQSLSQKSLMSQMTPQPHVSMSQTPQQQQLTVSQQQQTATKSSTQQRDHPMQQSSAPRNPQSAPTQQQSAKPQISVAQKPSSTAVVQPSTMQSAPNDGAPVVETDEMNKRIISKRSIQELVTQIDPSEKLDPEVEDIMIDIAEEFIESITTFGCSLAKHRRSSTLEAKDILLHLERNWSMALPGFAGDEIKIYKKPVTNDIHRERLSVVRKSIAGAETGNSKSPGGQSSASAKGHLGRAPPNVSGH